MAESAAMWKQRRLVLKLVRLQCERLAEQVASYCAETGEVDEPHLIAIQAFDKEGDRCYHEEQQD